MAQDGDRVNTSYKDKLKALLPRLREKQYRRDEAGEERARLRARGGVPRRRVAARRSTGGRPGGDGGRQGADGANTLDPKGDARVRPIKPTTDVPEVVWSSEQSVPTLAGRAAEYTATNNTITVNRDFFVFRRTIERYEATHGHFPAASQRIRDIVEDAFSLELAARVVHVMSLKGLPTWGRDPGPRQS